MSANEHPAPPESALLERCPVCTYSLTGLPVEHNCPECGFVLDRRWQVFGGPNARSTALRVVRIVALIVSAGLLLELCTFYATVGMRIHPVLFAIGISIVLLIIWRSRMNARGFVVVSDDAVLTFQKDRRTACFPAHAILAARSDGPWRTLSLEIRGRGEVHLSAHDYFAWTMTEVDRCAVAVKALFVQKRMPRTANERAIADAGDSGD